MTEVNRPAASPTGPTPGNDPFVGGGECGGSLRSMDWSKRMPGPIDGWPHSLRTAQGICLASRQPTGLIWGAERVHFYNDAYRALLGTRHPYALRQSYPAAWPEIWARSLRPLVESVEGTGETAWCDDLPLVLPRNGYDEEGCCSFSFAPVRVEDGSVGGVFTTVTDTTAQVVSARRFRSSLDPAGQASAAALSGGSVASGAKPTAGDPAPRSPSARNATSSRILLAADIPEIRGEVERLVMDRHAFVSVANRRTSLAAIAEWRPDLILVDGMSPGPDGSALTDALRADPATREIPIVLLSADAAEARFAGAEASAAEPGPPLIDARQLRANIEAHLHLAEVRRSAAVQLSASAARFEQLVAMMPAGMIACDAQGSLLFFNRRATEIWRAEPEPHQSYTEFAARFRVLDAKGVPVPTAERHVARALRDGLSFHNTESLMERPDGTRFVAQFNIAPTFDSHGTINGVIVVFQDITAEREAAAALQETQERYRAIFHQASVGIFECDLAGKIVRTNPALSRMMGFSPDELNQMNWRDLTHPDELAADEVLAGRLARNDIASINEERRYRRKGGSFGWVDVFATLIRDATGAPAHGLAVVIDLTERKRAEAGLRETEARFREAADSAPVLIWLAEHDRRRTWFNQPWLNFVGRSLAEESGDGWIQNLHPLDAARCLAVYHTAFDRQESYHIEYRLKRHDGEYRWLLAHGVPRYQDNEFVGFIGSCVDITDRRTAEEAMIESRNAERARRQEVEILTQVAPAGIWITHDPECREITGNAAAFEMMRVPHGQNLSLTTPHSRPGPAMTIFHHGRAVPLEELSMRVAARTGLPVPPQEFEFRFEDGTSTWVYGSSTPLLAETGRVRGVICVMLDVTERKRADAALRLSEEQLRLVTDHTSVMLARIDRQHRYRFVNRTYSKRYGRPVEEFVGRPVADVIGWEAYEDARPQIERALAGESSRFELFYPESSRWGHVVYEPERAPDGSIVGFVVVIVDITDAKEAGIEMKRARDEALAASRAKDDFLAALSHELRTPLTPVLLLASEAAADDRLAPAVRRDFEVIRKSIELEARLIDDLLDLTRITRDKLVLDLQRVDLSIVVRDALATVTVDLTDKCIEADVDAADGSVWVLGDPVRLQQVFWNILKNAVKFTPVRGRVRLISRVDVTGTTAVVEISDTGIGLTPNELSRVFEAFAQGDHATAGGPHRFGGLGLGLAISRRVVELHDGRISAESPGRDQGATFRVTLPVLPSENDASAPAGLVRTAPVLPPGIIVPDPASIQIVPEGAATAPPQDGHGARILLVEDHTPTRSALEILLIRRNYRVRVAASLTEARACADEEQFDVLISDIGLPDGSGYDLMKELRERHGLAGISLTGYGMEADVSRSRAAGFAEHLTKPVRMQSLDNALARITRPASGP